MSDAMGDETYSTTGGALKLKGVVGSRVDKKKRRKKKAEQDGDTKGSAKEAADSEQKGEANHAEHGEEPTAADDRSAMSSKTEAERRFEEMRRQRV
jgi:protein FAM32A